MATPTPVFPAAVATNAQLKVANNIVQTTLRVAVDAANTILFVPSITGFAADMLVSIDKEIIAIADIVGAPNPALLVASGGRGFDGTAAAAHSAGAKVSVLIDAWHHNVLASEVKAIQQFLGPNGQNIANSSGFVTCSQYNFAPQTPGGSLTVGTNVITLAPVPLGVNGSDANHHLYISGGAETAEAVLITGGTAVAGAASGTVFVTCVRAHTGAWTISSATGGLQEALNVAAIPRSVSLAESIALHAPVTFRADSGAAVWGTGMTKVAILRASDYPNGNMLQTSGGTPWIDLRDFQMQSATGQGQTGAAIFYDAPGGGAFSNIENLYIVNGAVGIKISGGSNVNLRNVKAINFDTTNNPVAGLWLTAPAGVANREPFGIVISDCSFGSVGGNSCGLLLDAVDGMQCSNTSFGGTYGIIVRGIPGDSYIANCFFSNCMVDAPLKSAVIFESNGAGGPLQTTMKFVGCHFAGQYNTTGGTTGTEIGIDIGAGAGITFIDELEFIGCHVEGFADYGVYVSRPGARQISFLGCRIYDNNLGNRPGRAAFAFGPATANVSISGCDIGNTAAVGGKMNYALAAFGTQDNCLFTGNTIRNMTVGNFFIGAAITNSIRRNNLGEDNVMPVVLSGAAFTFPTAPNFLVSGTTGITSVVMTYVAPGTVGMLRTTDGAVTFTAGATIGNTLTTTQNVPVMWTWDGTKLWLR